MRRPFQSAQVIATAATNFNYGKRCFLRFCLDQQPVKSFPGYAVATQPVVDHVEFLHVPPDFFEGNMLSVVEQLFLV